jgi:hypothetical protein
MMLAGLLLLDVLLCFGIVFLLMPAQHRGGDHRR